MRPEQNIPEVFANPGTVFKPIDEVDNASDVNDNDGNVINDVSTGAISRDDIVVTMRSVNVWIIDGPNLFLDLNQLVPYQTIYIEIEKSSIL